MEGGWSGELKVVTDELAEGMEKAMQLRLHLCSTSFCEAEDFLLQRIISSFEKALCFLKWSGHVGPPSSAAPEPSISADGTDDLNKNHTDYHDHGAASKKRYVQQQQ